ncbi:MAG: hypothetical protein CfClM3_1004 [Methanobrevibacter sp. CfCl-M3]
MNFLSKYTNIDDEIGLILESMNHLYSFTESIYVNDLDYKSYISIFLYGLESNNDTNSYQSILDDFNKNNQSDYNITKKCNEFTNKILKAVINNLNSIRQGVYEFSNDKKQWQSMEKLLAEYKSREPLTSFVNNVGWQQFKQPIRKRELELIYGKSYDINKFLSKKEQFDIVLTKFIDKMYKLSQDDFTGLKREDIELLKIYIALQGSTSELSYEDRVAILKNL